MEIVLEVLGRELRETVVQRWVRECGCQRVALEARACVEQPSGCDRSGSPWCAAGGSDPRQRLLRQVERVADDAQCLLTLR